MSADRENGGWTSDRFCQRGKEDAKTHQPAQTQRFTAWRHGSSVGSARAHHSRFDTLICGLLRTDATCFQIQARLTQPTLILRRLGRVGGPGKWRLDQRSILSTWEGRCEDSPAGTDPTLHGVATRVECWVGAGPSQPIRYADLWFASHGCDLFPDPGPLDPTYFDERDGFAGVRRGKRDSGSRDEILRAHHFDPNRHVEPNPAPGLLRWTDEAPTRLRDDVRIYFLGRREDGCCGSFLTGEARLLQRAVGSGG